MTCDPTAKLVVRWMRKPKFSYRRIVAGSHPHTWRWTRLAARRPAVRKFPDRVHVIRFTGLLNAAL
jgi:hypothetical protein